MVYLVNSHTHATRIGWHLWNIDLICAPGLTPGRKWRGSAPPPYRPLPPTEFPEFDQKRQKWLRDYFRARNLFGFCWTRNLFGFDFGSRFQLRAQASSKTMTRTASRSAREGGTWKWASPAMARATLLVFLAAVMPVADAWRVGDAAPGMGPSGGRPGLRGKSQQGTATPAFQLLPSMGMGHLTGARRQGISLAPPPRLKVPQSRQGRVHLEPFALRMAQQPSTPPMEQTSISELDDVYEKMASGQVCLPMCDTFD